jgi:glycosyltransferase involved in cell wall biosynthesis
MPRRAVWAQKRCLQALSQVGHIVADSEAMRNELERFLPPPSPPISVVYLGIDSLCQSVHSSNSREQALKKFGLDHSVKLLVVGRSDPHKYLEGTLKIFARLLQWKVDAMLVKLGSDLTEEQKRLADRLGIGSRIRYLGTVLREELPAIYSSCNLLLHLSFYEGFGFPVLEAMACGLPVVASDIPVLREIAVDAAVFVDPLDEEAAAETVAAVLEERMDVASLIERGKCRAAEFTWEKTAQKTLEIYREVYERTKRK